jgi:hypothetical protein
MSNRLRPQAGRPDGGFDLRGEHMSFEKISLLLNWVRLGVLLAILFRLHHTFDLIATTQRELRRAIHHLGDHRATEPSSDRTRVGDPLTRVLAPFAGMP